MKYTILALLSVFSISALANDGGVVGVVVDDLKMSEYNWNDGEKATTPIKGEKSISMTFKGKQIAELMKWLPGARSVIKETEKYQRSIAIAANEGFVSIYCQSGEYDYDVKTESGRWKATEPTCTVTLEQHAEPVADEFVTDWFGDFQKLEVPNSCQMP